MTFLPSSSSRTASSCAGYRVRLRPATYSRKRLSRTSEDGSHCASGRRSPRETGIRSVVLQGRQNRLDRASAGRASGSRRPSLYLDFVSAVGILVVLLAVDRTDAA